MRLAYLNGQDEGTLGFTSIEQACTGTIEFSELGRVAIQMQVPVGKYMTTNNYDLSAWNFDFEEALGWRGSRVTTSVYRNNATNIDRRTIVVNGPLANIVANTIFSSYVEVMRIGSVPLTKREKFQKLLYKYGPPLATAVGSIFLSGPHGNPTRQPRNY
jgi:hypothetical protein